MKWLVIRSNSIVIKALTAQRSVSWCSWLRCWYRVLISPSPDFHIALDLCYQAVLWGFGVMWTGPLWSFCGEVSVLLATSCYLTPWSVCLFYLVKRSFFLWTSHPNNFKSSGQDFMIWISWLVKQMCADLHQSNDWQSSLSLGFFSKNWVLFDKRGEWIFSQKSIFWKGLLLERKIEVILV